MSTTEQRPTIDHTDWLLGQLAETLDRAAKMATELAETLAKPTTAPSYYPERMGYMDDIAQGDRAMWDGSWHEVTVVRNHPDGDVTIHANTAEALTSPGTYGIRIQKRADEQQADALHRRDNGGL